jgi:hypothetical protein
MNFEFTKVITAIDHERNEDHRYCPKEFIDSEIGKEEEATCESPEVRGRKGSCSMVIVCGHINEEV